MTKQRMTLREIDAAIATCVFGHSVGKLVWYPTDDSDDFVQYRNTATGNVVSGLAYHEGDLMEGDAKLTPYSAEIAAAWDMLNHIPGRDFRIDHSRHLGCRATLIDTAMEELDVVAIARGFPVAACLAALKNHGIDVEVADD